MKWIPFVALAIAACAEPSDPISSKVTLDGESWTAAAYSSDVHSPQEVTISLVKHLDRQECASVVFDMVEIRLLIGDRSEPHNLAPLDVTTPFSGMVEYTDGDQNRHRAVSGYVWPGETVWQYSEAEGHNVVVEIDGEFDVTLADGRELSGAFSATPCAGYPL